MANPKGGTATETEGTRTRKHRSKARRSTGAIRGTTAGITIGRTSDRYLNTFDTIVGALRSLEIQQRPQMLELCNRFVATDWHGTTGQTLPTTEQRQTAAAGY